jgi:O-antigen ligase
VLVAALERRVQNLILFALLGMTLLVTPWMNLDPINLPKYLVLVVTGLALLGNLAPYLTRVLGSESRFVVAATLIFLAALVIVYLFNLGSSNQLHGAYGRNTGLLSYAALALVLLAVVFVSNRGFLAKILNVLVLTGVVNAVYGLIQWMDLDPVNWSNPYNPIVGTLGNPNFTSAHLGIAALASLALVLGEKSLGWRFALVLNVLLSLFVVYESDSSQGLLVFGLGAGLLVYLRFLRGKFILGSIYLAGYTSVILVGVLGILNKGPLASYLYQDSVTYRGDYWRAGWKMTVDNPLFGVGLDSYGDWYRFYRNEAAALRRGPDVTSNSAHNVFLDISSNGGFLLLLAYLMIVGLIVRSGFRIIKRAESFDAIGAGLVITWLAYLVQSVISINQLGLAIWGWVLGGAIIGYDVYRDRGETPKAKRVAGKRPEQVPANIVITGSLGLVIGVLISIWPLAQDVSFRTALQSGDATKIVAAADAYPGSTYYFNYAGDILLRNKLEDQALELARKSIEMNPRDFNGWKLLISNPKLDEVELEKAIAEMKRLDPFNNTLGQK